MTTKTENDLNRLPKWARFRISKLEADVSYWQTKAYQAMSDTPSRVKLGSVHPEEPRYLPDDTRLTYAIAPNGNYLETRIERGYLSVRSTRSLQVIPTSGGEVIIRWADWPQDA